MTLAEWMEDHPALYSEWHGEANAGVSLESVSSASRKKAWWQCERGHVWEAAIYSRTQGGSACPYCSGKRVIEGENDLATRFPGVLAMWDTEKNEKLLPSRIFGASHKVVWWKCESGHSWQARVDSMTLLQSGCPYCKGKKVAAGFNDLATTEPKVAEQWNAQLNEMSSDSVTRGSKKKAWWTCERGHTWQAQIHTRSGKAQAECPYCRNRRVLEGFNDLATTDPGLAEQWCDELNGALKPTDVMRGMHRKVWWKCNEGHVWEAYLFARSKENGTGCPICSGRYKKRA